MSSTNDKKILIETNENDYMTYFQEASCALSNLMKNWTLDWDEKRVKESFISLTNSFHLIIEGTKINPEYLKTLSDNLEIYFGQEAEDKSRELDINGNGSDVRINWSNW